MDRKILILYDRCSISGLSEGVGSWVSEVLLLEEVDHLVNEAAALSRQSVLSVAGLNQHAEQFLAIIL